MLPYSRFALVLAAALTLWTTPFSAAFAAEDEPADVAEAEPAGVAEDEPAAPAAPAVESSESDGSSADAEWNVLIRPAPRSAVVAVQAGQPGPELKDGNPNRPAPPAAAESEASPPAYLPMAFGPRMTYWEAYNSVPFLRSEYEANPGYRHDAAMEIMFGAMRPTTVVKQNVPYASRYPDFLGHPQPVVPTYPYYLHHPRPWYRHWQHY